MIVSRWTNFWTSLIFRQLMCSDRNNIPLIGNYSQIVNLSKAYINRKCKFVVRTSNIRSQKANLACLVWHRFVKTRSCHVHVTFYSWSFDCMKNCLDILKCLIFMCMFYTQSEASYIEILKPNRKR